MTLINPPATRSKGNKCATRFTASLLGNVYFVCHGYISVFCGRPNDKSAHGLQIPQECDNAVEGICIKLEMPAEDAQPEDLG